MQAVRTDRVAGSGYRPEAVNRRAAPEPSPATVARLHELMDRLAQANTDVETAKDALYLGAYEACKVEGAGQQQVADAVGRSKSLVHYWVKRGAQLRAGA